MAPLFSATSYNISVNAREVLPERNEKFASLLAPEPKTGEIVYNQGYIGNGDPADLALEGAGNPRVKAKFQTMNEKSVTLTDPIENTSLTITPKFRVSNGKQDLNQIVYPLSGLDGHLVYTAQITGVKEDILLYSYKKNKLVFEYELQIPAGMQSRLEANGSIGVYASDVPLHGDVSTAGDDDTKLLNEARQRIAKNKLLFSLPAPVVIESDKTVSDVKAHFELNGNELRLIAEGLETAQYPLSIDPSVYVETAQKLMRGNNESNLDFDVANELIQKGELTGGRFNSLTSSLDLPSSRWSHATAVAGGYIYVTGGNDGTNNQQTVYWSKLNTTTNALEGPNPGNGACSTWCTSSAYNLPFARARHSMVAYNGYLYVMGGVDGTNTRTNTVYIAKLGSNGEPSLWHPTDTNKNNWVYWYTSPVPLSSERSYTAAAAYNNRIYIMGGQTNTSPTGISTMEYATLTPLGTFSSWTTTGMTSLPSTRYGHSIQVYNDRIYLIGGNSAGSIQSTVHYIKIKSNGTVVSSWAAANGFTTPRQSWGGNFSALWGGYLYVSGGCTTVDAEGECTSTGISNAGGVELASLNADGSIGEWSTIAGVTNSRIGYGFVAWRNTLYVVGGCTAQNTTTGGCTTTSASTSYGVINNDGDVSSVSEYQASGSGNCLGADPYDCDLPPVGDDAGEIGHMLSGVAIMNGYIYVIGGCGDNTTTIECNAGDAMSSNIAYAAISSDGSLHRSPSCVGSYYGSWCVDSTNIINGVDGVGAAGVTVFEGRIYVIGGLDNTVDGVTSISSVGINSDGSLAGQWSQQSFANLGITGELAHTFAYARANPSSANTYPGNIYIFGGCGAIDVGVECDNNNYRSEVYKCNIRTGGLLEEDDANDCDTANQLQIDTEALAGNQGLGLHSGAVYANYIYLTGGYSANVANRNTVFYAKFDNNNNIVDADSGTATSGDSWTLSNSTLSAGRGWGSSFGYNGHLYVIGGYNSVGGAAIGSIQFAKFDVSTGNIGAFQTSTVSFSQRWGQSVIVSNSYAYLIGGCNAGSAPAGCTSFEPSPQVFRVYNNSSGTPAGYASASSGSLFGTDRFGAGSAIHNGYVYIAGGCISTTDCGDATNSVQYAPLQDNGTIGTWATAANLPADRVFGQLEIAGGTLYYIGGQNDGAIAQSTIYYATPAANGAIASWSTASGGIGNTAGSAAVPRSQLSSAVWNNRIYITGGYDSSLTATGTVFISPQLSSGGNIPANSWTSSTAFNIPRYHHTAIAYANNLYILGGFNGSVPMSDVQFAKINSNGTLTGWTYTTSLPQRIRGSDGFAANGYMYLFGGKLEDTTCNNFTYVAPVAANTTIASGNNPTGIGEWFVTNARFNGERASVTAVYNEGKAFVMGGACGVLQSGGTTTVMEDDFDPGIDSSMWTDTTNTSINTQCGNIAGGNSLNSNGNSGSNLSQAATKNVDVSFGGTVSFYLRIPSPGTGNCVGPNVADEDLVLEYSNNNGSSWTVIATYQEDAYDTPTLIQETIPTAARTANTRFRWHILNGDNNSDKWAIDNVVITANTVPPTSEVLFDDFDPSIDSVKWISTTGMNNGTGCGTIASGNNLNSSGGTSNAVSTDTDLRYGGRLRFWLRLPTNNGGDCSQLNTGEDLLVQYSTDSGNTWTTFATFDRSSYNTPQEVNAVLPQAGWSSAVRFRWIVPNTTTGRWAIDNVSINAFQSILTYTGANRVVYSSLLSQPQIAKYSRMIDTDTDVFPTKWLVNGLDNDVGARWFMRYRSSTNAAAAWGQDTIFGRITLGQPENYVPLDGAGANTNFARYYFMDVNIDSSQAFGYPEDVSRGPTINDISLFFTSNPSKRMRHGRTFTGGEKQPLDTPF